MNSPSEYYSAFFSPKNNVIPFSSASQLLGALGRWAKIILYAALQSRLHSTPETASFMSAAQEEMTAAAGVISSSFDREANGGYENEPAFTDAVTAYNNIMRRVAVSSQLRPQPFMRLCATLKPDIFDMFCLAATSLYYAKSSYSQWFALACGDSFGAEREIGIRLEHAAQVFYGGSGEDVYESACAAARRLAPLMLTEQTHVLSKFMLTCDDRLFSVLNGSDDFEWLEGVSVCSAGESIKKVFVNAAQSDDLTRRSFARLPSYVNISGPYGSGKKEVLKRACREWDADIIFIDFEALTELPAEKTEQAILYAKRELLWRNAVLCACGLNDEISARWHKRLHGERTAFLLSEEPLCVPNSAVNLRLEIPDALSRHKMWTEFLSGAELDSGVDLWSVTNKYAFTAGNIRRACREAVNRAAGGVITEENLYSCCGERLEKMRSGLSVSRKSNCTWDDLIIKDDVKQMLMQACSQIKYRHVVYEQWGFNQKLSYGNGTVILMHGPAGTGKTMAAGIIANELKLELYAVDISKVVDKYIGETEKNIGRIFEEAKKSNVVLFFDEADALFGKRSEVTSSNDRHANFETGYLLQCIERYDGMTILATNYLRNIDEAFMRRIRFQAEFSNPDAQARMQIWKNIYPRQTKLAEDVDLSFLAENFAIAGGNIKNIAVNSAFMAAACARQCIAMEDIVKCLRQEVVKMGMVFTRKSLGRYEHLLD